MTLRAALAALVTGAVATLGADLRAEPTPPAATTAIERALVERACSTPVAVAVDPVKHEECLDAKLSSLRADFGNDLSRLSGVERRKIDSACGPVRGTVGREGYLDCLGSELTVIRNRWSRARGATSTTAPVAEAAPALPPVATPASTSDPGTSSSRKGLLATLATVLSASAIVPLVIRKRRARRVCAGCKGRAERAGEICMSCHREAAVAQRRATAERLERQSAQEKAERLQAQHDEEERRTLARETEDARLQQEQLARQTEEAARRQEDEASRQAENAERQPRAGADAGEVAFDPYAILGVPHDASFDAIQAAHQQAKSKYDFDQVADLGVEIQQHYQAKAQAVDRAFQMLTESHRRAPDVVTSQDAPLDREDGARAF